MDVHLDQGIISVIAALLGFAVRYSVKAVNQMTDMALSLREIAINVNHVNEKIGMVTEITKDHEQRLRVIETKKIEG